MRVVSFSQTSTPVFIHQSRPLKWKHHLCKNNIKHWKKISQVFEVKKRSSTRGRFKPLPVFQPNPLRPWVPQRPPRVPPRASNLSGGLQKMTGARRWVTTWWNGSKWDEIRGRNWGKFQACPATATRTWSTAGNTATVSGPWRRRAPVKWWRRTKCRPAHWVSPIRPVPWMFNQTLLHKNTFSSGAGVWTLTPLNYGNSNTRSSTADFKTSQNSRITKRKDFWGSNKANDKD